MKDFFKKYREIIIYLIVGFLTTAVSWGACFLAKFFLDSTNDWQNFIINTIGWCAGVLFSYPLNRKWVFKSHNKNIPKEFFGFAGSRLSTWILDIIIMWGFVNSWFGVVIVRSPFEKLCNGSISFLADKTDTLHYWFVKIFISAVLVTIANYVFSKFLVFGKKKKDKENAQKSSFDEFMEENKIPSDENKQP